YLVFGNSVIDNNIELSMYDSVAIRLGDVQIGDSWEQVASNRPIANATDGNFYGYSHKGGSPYPLSTNPADLHLVKFDSNMNIIFEKFYSHYGRLFALDIAPSADGGCIMISTIYDTTINRTELGLLVLKVDSLGNYTPTSISTEKEALSITVYPNPGNSQINVELPLTIKEASFSLYSLTGQLLLTKQVGLQEQSISTTELAKGMFIYKIEANNVLIGKGKWLKE
ncbi:MAG: T9SS type A sorting domain-containing protein, partial [Salinivirgaceae bacterium]|nr:T9SS type A sorting domain-containing protein [Salinivirgaceae bacterium]